MIFIVEDDDIMAECLELAVREGLARCKVEECEAKIKKFTNAIEAMQAIDEVMPRLIFLDVLLDGPDGFTFLNELASYADTAQIPIVIISSLDLSKADLSIYGVVRILDKTKMKPEEIGMCVREFYGDENA